MKTSLLGLLVLGLIACTSVPNVTDAGADGLDPSSDSKGPTAPLSARAKTAIARMPKEYGGELQKALAAAGENQSELIGAMEKAKNERREGVAFLIANMPRRDLVSLKSDFILRNVECAYLAREKSPWGRDIPNDLFLNYVLPYVNVNERRDDWRQDFYERFMPVVQECKTPSEAALTLNKEVFERLNVKYHASKRPKPDQSPYETLEAEGYASCTGLSIMLTDACRAVGVPARVAGTPMWTTVRGNHTWVEIWDEGWHYIGAAEQSPLSRAWFGERAAEAIDGDMRHQIYAASFRKTSLPFPLVWDRDIQYVPARNVTPYYTSRRNVTLKVLDKSGGKPWKAIVTFRLDGETYARCRTGKGEDAAQLELPGGKTYEADVAPAKSSSLGRMLRREKAFTTTVETSQEDGQEIVICPKTD